MHLAVTGAFQARWTEEIHDEWTRNLLKNRPDLTATQLARTRAMMNANAEGSLVAGYQRHIAALNLPDADDRHVLAAAIEAKAQVIVTWNLRHFPSDALTPQGIIAQHPDEFITMLYEQQTDRVREAVRRQRAFLRKPPKTVEDHLDTLTHNGLTMLVERLKPYSDEL